MASIGITYDSSTDLFLSGANQTAITLTELFQQLGYTVILLDRKNNDGKVDKFPKLDVCFSNIHNATNLDVLIDIDGLVNPSYRKKVATKSIVFLRTFVQFSELDKSVYPEGPYTPRNFEGINEIWCWDILNPPETLDSIQTLFSCPIRTVPFIWSPTPISPYTINADYKINPQSNWTIHIAEKNINNSNSAIFPIVAVRELSTHSERIKYKCHNMKKIKENKFCKVNVLENIEFEKLPIEFVEDMPFYKWLNTENNILFSHSRFTPLRIALLNSLWLGIPMIHNSPILKELHPVLNKSFYFGNRVNEILTALTYLSSDFCKEYIAATDEIKQNVLEKWSITKNIDAWKVISSTLVLRPTVKAFDSNKKIIIAFSDMWPGFNYSSNFIIDSLKHEVKTQNIEVDIIGVEYNRILTPNLVIFGPYSHSWKQIPTTIPKVYFSGENWTQPDDPSISLYLSSSRKEDERHFRIPTWMTFIDWFSNSTELPESCQDNPIRIPLHFATNSHPIPFDKRTEWCGFVVSNPICTLRNNTFKIFNDYKKVNSGGALYNNIGGQLSLKYPGGGCGDISKHKFFSNHKFTISFENSQADGYVTEKLLHAKMAGCIPIYWGDYNAQQEFHPLSFINVSHEHSPEKILEIVKNLESKPELCAQVASQPLLRNNDVRRSLKIISNMSKKLLELCGIEMIKPLERVDKIFVINLDTRKDRWESLCKAEPIIAALSERISAVNGKTLELTPSIKKLFKNNNFGWRKSVIGCAMSHINVWTEIASSSGEYFLVLEDDVRFNPTQLKLWSEYAANIPQGADLLYLGGVLPSNTSVFPSVLESVNTYWAKIKPNKYFSPSTPLPIFHFCLYSYIISKSAAQKFLYYLMNASMTTPVDHFVVSAAINLNTFVAQPLIASCFQCEDPNYLNANFDSSVSKFDSDIYNNLDSFEDDETVIFTMNEDVNLYEDAWIKNIFGKYTLKKYSDFSNQHNCWFLLQRPHVAALNIFFKQLDEKGIPFKILHLSDEGLIDYIDCYNYSNCKSVIRNYVRSDANLPHVLTIPLGYHYCAEETTKAFSERELVWSFHGNDWFGRAENLKNLQQYEPNNCHLIKGWAASNMTNQTDYLTVLTNSKLCPIMRGNNFETYRLYEALEAGVIPFYVRTEGDQDFWKFITSHIPLINIPTWDKVSDFISALLSNPVGAEDYRKKLMVAWKAWKLQIMSDIKKIK